ncbi:MULTISPECIES: ABC transporter permease [Spirosoma]|uniref:ABC transporter permease n=2 Tax=Spirosoma TaxID=107 RepID=A0A6G9AHP3_9BACT|nr:MULTISPECIES: ABC transporter permease [Spirosoma]QHW01086.1 ABC transporter permease [Spirosoma endbachense]QIP11958.1 ABC transporter permease [Spirosoma aureum]
MIRFLSCCLFFAAVYCPLFAQQSYDIEAGKPAQLNGIDYGFEINNERRIEISGESFMRYEVTIYVTNKSNCTKLFFPRQTVFGQENLNELASFDCLNANGKRLTSKGGKIMARPFTVPYQQKIKNAEGKEVTTTTNIQAGHMIRNGETVNNTFIAIVPNGERPQMKVRIREIPDL